MIRLTAIAVAIVAAASATAAEWVYDLERGLDSYTITGDGGTVVLVCDPDRAYNPDKSYANFVVEMPVAQSVTQVVFLAETGEQAAFMTREGIATQQDADAEEWSDLIAMAQAGGRIAVVTEDDSFTVTADPMPELRCD
ncbi:hypothetical protein LX81_03601 [Palleronia aestuarii]|uniref:Uncharacterized protein n=1 Tax=Palleronia aestuarii TaxID=568105 RepID=A0A2W7N2C3_9RHOB|nr:hypothetical protein [Palleronia aestuarii]PZX12497.1 hypothetical protein LX81_03601 [Palleronia aestuarii]